MKKPQPLLHCFRGHSWIECEYFLLIYTPIVLSVHILVKSQRWGRRRRRDGGEGRGKGRDIIFYSASGG